MSIALQWFTRASASTLIVANLLLRLDFTALKRLNRVNTLFDADKIIGNFSDMRGMFLHNDMAVRAPNPSPLPAKPAPLPKSFEFRGKTYDLAQWQAARCQTAIVVLKDGALTHEAYFHGTTTLDQRISWSMAKSYLSVCIGIALSEGLLQDLDEKIVTYVPKLRSSAYRDVSLRQVLNMASGVAFDEDYLEYHSDINRMGRVLALGGSMDDFAASLTIQQRAPGSRMKYVSIDTHVLGMVLRAVTGREVHDYMAEKLLRPLGMEADAYYLTDGLKTDFTLGGLNITTRDYARFGLMVAQDGEFNGQQIVPKAWLNASSKDTAPPPAEEVASFDDGALRYGYQWWLPPEAEQGEFFAIGVYGQYIYINKPKKCVIAINSADRNFKEGNGRITLTNLAMLRHIANS